MATSDYLQQLKNDKDTMVENLTTKGITGLTGDETFTELVPEVLNIPSGSGPDWSAIGYSGEPQVIQDGYDYAKQIYDNWDSTQTSMMNKFSTDKDLLFMPLVNTSNVTSFNYMFRNCFNLINVPLLDTSNVTDFSYMFRSCYSLKTIPQFNTSNGKDFNHMFLISGGTVGGCSLKSISKLDLKNATNIGSMISIYNIINAPTLTDLGGFENLGQAYLTSQSANNPNYKLQLSDIGCNNLTHDSLMNVINNLYDIATKGCNTQQLQLGSTNLAKLTAEEIAIATNKGWTVS